MTAILSSATAVSPGSFLDGGSTEAGVESYPSRRIRTRAKPLTAPTASPRPIEAEASTDRPSWAPEFHELLYRLFETGKQEHFEDGLESAFSKILLSLLGRHGNAMILAIAPLLVGEKVNAEVASEALRWLGMAEHLPSRRNRLASPQVSFRIGCIGDPVPISGKIQFLRR